MINFFKTIFNLIFIVIYILNTIELIGHRLGQKGIKKELLGIEIAQLVIVSTYILLLVIKGAF